MGRQLILEIACLLVTLYATTAESLKPRFEATDLLPDTRHCGQSFQNRIYGGSSTHINEYPWTALIRSQKLNDSGYYFCGGALINNRYVLTAAHCLLSQKLNVIKAPVRLGEWDITTDPDCEMSKNGQRYCADPHLDFGIEEFILHPNYTNIMLSENRFSKKHDIALIRLDRYVNFTEFIQPVCLPIQPRLRVKTYVGSQMVAAGWGGTAMSVYSTVKQRVYLSGVNLDVCSKQYNVTGIPILDTHLCAGGDKGGGTCKGDSGSPLVYQQSVDFRNVYVLAGIVSFGFSTCGGGTIVSTRVGSYMDWIQENLRP